MFRLVVLDPGLLDRVRPTAPSTIWRGALRDAGFLAEPPGATPVERQFRGVRVELEGMDKAETNVTVASQPVSWLVGGVPKAVIWGAVALFLVLTLISQITDVFSVYVTGLFRPLIAIVGTPVLLTPLALFGLGWTVWMDVRRRAFGVESESERQRHGRNLYAHAEALSFETFLVPSGSVLLVSAPHLAWLVHRLRDLRVNRPQEPTPEREELVFELGALRDQMEAALRAAASGAVPAPEALQCDICRLNERFAALHVPPDRSGEGARLAAELPKRAAGG